MIPPSRVVGLLRLEDDILITADGCENLNSSECWTEAQAIPRPQTRERISSLLETERLLQETFSDRKSICLWLETDNRYLGGIKPIEALRVGRYDRVEAALEALASGVFI